MQTLKFWVVSLMFLSMMGVATAHDGRHKHKILALDDCDPTDPDYALTGGCALKRGDVTVEEFNELLPAGHPAWRFDPAYIKIKEGQSLKIINRGGRTHTFTEVEEFGGGFVEQLNTPGIEPAPECLDRAIVDASTLQPGDRLKIREDEAGLELHQCCIHPWMRIALRVEERKYDEKR
jgi:plastocyanin